MIFLTSDTHWYHKNIIKFCKRPFDSIEEMNQALIDNWNSVVGPDDTVYHIGDIAFGPLDEILDQLNGNIILIRGNHDRRIKSKKLTIVNNVILEHSGYKFFLNHRPFLNKGTDDPYNDAETKTKINVEDYDRILCGHVHDKWVTLDNNINLSVDVWDFTPISIDKLIAFIENEK